MPYSYKKGLVEQSEHILAEIVRCMKEGKRAEFWCSYADLNTNVHRMHNLLASTNVLREEAEGRYVGLREQVRIRVDTSLPAIIVEAKAGGASLGASITIARPNEATFLEAITSTEGTSINHKFWPSRDFRLLSFEAEVNRLGYELTRHHETGDILQIEGDDGSVMMLATKVRKVSTAFDILNRQS